MDQFSPDPLNASSADEAHNRDTARDSLFLMADFRLAGTTASQPVRVRNLSSGGLMAEWPDGLEIGSKVEFHVRGIGWVPGRVAWSAAGRVGVEFDRVIDPLLARKPVGNGTQTPVFTKPIFTRR